MKKLRNEKNILDLCRKFKGEPKKSSKKVTFLEHPVYQQNLVFSYFSFNDRKVEVSSFPKWCVTLLYVKKQRSYVNFSFSFQKFAKISGKPLLRLKSSKNVWFFSLRGLNRGFQGQGIQIWWLKVPAFTFKPKKLNFELIIETEKNQLFQKLKKIVHLQFFTWYFFSITQFEVPVVFRYGFWDNFQT